MATVPSIANIDRTVDATATPGQTAFTISWPVIADSELLAVNDFTVTIDDEAVDPADYSFTGVAIVGLSGMWNGGTLTLDNACAGGERVLIASSRTPRRTGRFLEGASLPMTELDKLMDDFAVMLRDLSLLVERSGKISLADLLDGTDPDTVLSDFLDTAAEVDADAAAAAASAALAAAYAALITAAVGMYSTPVSAIRNAPTGAEASGTRYIVGTSPTGAFAAKADYIAQLSGTTWLFAPPLSGLVLQGANLGAFYSYMNSAWRYGLCVGGDTKAISAEVYPVLDVVQDNTVSTAFASCISQFGATGAPTFHTHKFRGTPAAPTKGLVGDLLVSWGLRACRETGSVGGSPAALFVTLLEDSNGTDYPGINWAFRGTSIGAGAPTNWIYFYQGNLGVNDATPATLISAQLNTNGAASTAVRNTSSGANALAQVIADNGTKKLQIGQYGESYSGSGVTAASTGFITSDGTGGLSIWTGANAPLYFGVSNTPCWNINTSGALMPSANNARNIGSAGIAVANIYSVNALNVTSDEATKSDIRDLTDQEIAAGNAIRWRMFKHVGGDRLHAGVTAQEVEAAFEAQKLDPYAYGVLGKSALTEDIEETETGEEDVHVMTTITHRREVVEIKDGLAVVSIVEETESVPAVDSFPAYTADGVAIMEQGVQRRVAVPRMEKKPYSRKVVRRDVPVLDTNQQPVMRRFVRYAELTAFCLAAHEARLDALEAGK